MPGFVVVALVAAGATLVLAVITRTGHIQHWDDGLEAWAGIHRERVHRVASIATLPGEWFAHPLMGAGIASILIVGRHVPPIPVLLSLAAASLGATASHHAVKFIYRRARPAGALARKKTEPAFPSGHTTNTTSVLVTGAFLLVHAGAVPRDLAIAVVSIVCLCVGASRVALGWHWSSDVVGGWLTGITVASLCSALFLVLSRP